MGASLHDEAEAPGCAALLGARNGSCLAPISVRPAVPTVWDPCSAEPEFESIAVLLLPEAQLTD
jgi:hypothetical protein